jgi:putative ABC transport system permease protein
MGAFFRRLRALFQRNRLERDLEDELAFHLAMREKYQVRQGESITQAKSAARRQFGSVLRTKEQAQEAWVFTPLDRMVQDARYAVRALRRSPAMTSVAVSTLAIGIAATTAIYSAIDAVQHFFPIVHRSGLVYAVSTDTRVIQRNGESRSVVLRVPVSVPDFADWMARSSTFEQFAGFAIGTAKLTGRDAPLRLSAIRITANLAQLWGFTPVVGRHFRPEEGTAAGEPVVMLSHRFWERHFSANPAVLGQTLQLNGVPHTMVGVLPLEAGTGLFRNADVFIPLVVHPSRGDRNERIAFVTGRLKPGITRQQASADLQNIARQLQTEHPQTNQSIGAVVLPLIESSGFNVRILLSLLAGIAVLVLLVACANVANMFIAQSIGRHHEFAIRAALGASRGDRIRQLVIEGAVVSAAAGVIGLAFAQWGVAGLRWLAGDSFGFADIRMNTRVVAVGVLAAAAAPLVFALLPALRTPDPDSQELRDTPRTAGATVHGRRMRHLIVALQAAAAMILMVQIALVVRTTWKLDQVVVGFDPSRVLSFRIGLSGPRYAQPRTIQRFAADVIARLRAFPGVASVGIIDSLPVADRETMARLTVAGAAPAPLEARPLIARSAFFGDYFSTMQIPVIQGRTFSTAEHSEASPVALVNLEAARRFWPGGNPLGARIALDAPAGQETWLQIIGVVANVRSSDIENGPLPQVYVPWFRRPTADMAVVVKSIGINPLEMVPAIRTQIASIDRDQPIHHVATMSKVLFDDLASTYVLAALLSAIGLVALSLSAAGIYGIVAHSVAQRGREIGVRMALGAEAAAIVRMVVTQAAKPVAVGSLVGFVAAVAVAFALSTVVSEFDARDPVNYAVVVVTMSIVTFTSSYLPARRATKVDPAVALRCE